MPSARFNTIYHDLKNKILDGTYTYESYLPSEMELTKIYSCSRNTVRRALALLSDEAFLQPIHGRGVRVIWQKKPSEIIGSLEGLESFQEYAHRNNLVPDTNVIVFEHVPCTDDISHQTGFKAGEELIHIVRIRKLDGSSRQIDNDYLLASAVGNLTIDDASTSIFAYLENTLHMKILKSKRTISVELATKEDLQHLELGSFNCVAVVESHSFNSRGVMFGFTQTRSHPETFCYKVISKR